MQVASPGTAAPSSPPAPAFKPADQPSRPAAPVRLGWSAGVCGLVTVLVLGLSLLGQLGTERDWLGRAVVLLLLGGQTSLAALQSSRWRAPSRS